MFIASIASAQQAGILESISPHVFSLVVILIVVFALIGINRLFLRAEGAEGAEGVTRVRKQTVMLALTVIGVIIIVLTLPVEESTEGQLLTLIGLAITAALTLASTTFIGNMMAGLMLRSVDNIRMGDFIKVGTHLGRVTERGLFHIEIQTEDRDLCTLPNLYVATTPTEVV
jgi:small-conductance mechanosensitive channel